jgi:hypothetical protein
MLQNKQNLSNDFNGQENIAKVKRNATEGLNLQTIDPATDDLNRQKVEASALVNNNQIIELDSAEANRQQLDVDALGEHRETLDVEVRAQNIQEVVGQVHKKLDHFEQKNLSFLAIGRTQKFTDDFVPIQEEESGINRQLVDDAFARMGLVSLAGNAQVKDANSKTRAKASASVVAADAVTVSATAPFSSTATATAKAQGGQSATPLEQAAPSQVRASSRPAIVFAKPKSAGMRLNLGSAGLTRRGLKVTYKQIAIALVTVVFASPIYTHSVKSRVSTGSLVKMEQLSPELVTQRQASGYEWVATLLAR